MPAFHRAMLLSLVAVVMVAPESRAQLPQPQINPFPWYRNPLNSGPWNPAFRQPSFPNPSFPWHKPQLPKSNPQGQLGCMPTFNPNPASNYFLPVFSPPWWMNPALNNPRINQVEVVPVRPVAKDRNQLFENPFALNPLLHKAEWFNELNLPGFVQQPGLADLGLLALAPAVEYTPPLAVREPGQYIFSGIDLQVNPATGSVYQLQSGVVTLGDGTKFYRVPGTSLPTVTGAYATGTGLYYNTDDNTFFNPRSGIDSQSGRTRLFLPYVW